MQKNAHHLLAVLVADLHLLGAHLAEHYRINRLEVGRVGREREMDAVAVRQVTIGGDAKMIFDVARALHIRWVGGLALELGKDGGIGFAHDVG